MTFLEYLVEEDIPHGQIKHVSVACEYGLMLQYVKNGQHFDQVISVESICCCERCGTLNKLTPPLARLSLPKITSLKWLLSRYGQYRVDKSRSGSTSIALEADNEEWENS